MYREYPTCICRECGELYGNQDCGVATWYVKQCNICGETTLCTEPRDFGHLKNEWRHLTESLKYKDPLILEELYFADLAEERNRFAHDITLDFTAEIESKYPLLAQHNREELQKFKELDKQDPYKGVIAPKPKEFRDWLSLIQIRNDDLAEQKGFSIDYTSAFRLVPEVGELVDVVLKLEGLKKIKLSDDISDLKADLRGEIGDVLVLLGQVATNYDIDMEAAFMDKYTKILERKFYT